MIWIIGAVVLGLILGVLGYYFTKSAYSLFVTTLGLFSVYSSSLADNVAAESSGQTSVFRLFGLIYRSIDNMGYLPQHIQLAIVIFVLIFFFARIVTWFCTKMGVKPAAEESKTDRKNRILEQYGYKNGIPY